MKIKKIFSHVLTIMFLVNCSDDGTSSKAADPTSGLIKVGDTTIATTQVEVYSDIAPQVGYINFYTKVTNSTTHEIVEQANVAISTLMDMGSYRHASPYENQAANMATDGLFHAAACFIMSGIWQLNLEISNYGVSDTLQFYFSIEVAPGNMVKNVTATDSNRYFITLVKPQNPVVGMNEFEITVHQKQSMMSFPPVENLTIAMEPSMPSMGHGSPNNVNPVHTELGHYSGQVNFTMTGDWLIDVDFTQGDSLMHSSFNINVP